MSIARSTLPILIFLSFLFIGQDIAAQEKESTPMKSKSWNRFSVRLGGFFAGYNSGLKVGSDRIGLGLLIDVEDVLGIKQSTTAFRGEAGYRFGKRERNLISVGYFGIFRSGRKVLEKELEIGDNVFEIGEELNTKFNFSIVRLKYDYTFFQDDRVSLGASFGFFIVPLQLSISTNAFKNQDTKFTAPLPLLGLRSNFRISEKFYLNQSIEFLYLSFSDYTGSILDLNITLEHKTFKNVAFGMGVNSNRLKIIVEKPDSPIKFYGDIGMDYTGVLFYVKYFL